MFYRRRSLLYYVHFWAAVAVAAATWFLAIEEAVHTNNPTTFGWMMVVSALCAAVLSVLLDRADE